MIFSKTCRLDNIASKLTEKGDKQLIQLAEILKPKLVNQQIYLVHQNNKKITATRDRLIENMGMQPLLENSLAVNWMYDGFLGYFPDFESLAGLIRSRQENSILAIAHEPFIEGYAYHLVNSKIPRENEISSEYRIGKGQCIEIDLNSKKFEKFP